MLLLKSIDVEILAHRREHLCSQFAKSCVAFQPFRVGFPKIITNMLWNFGKKTDVLLSQKFESIGIEKAQFPTSSNYLIVASEN